VVLLRRRWSAPKREVALNTRRSLRGRVGDSPNLVWDKVTVS